MVNWKRMGISGKLGANCWNKDFIGEFRETKWAYGVTLRQLAATI